MINCSQFLIPGYPGPSGTQQSHPHIFIADRTSQTTSCSRGKREKTASPFRGVAFPDPSIFYREWEFRTKMLHLWQIQRQLSQSSGFHKVRLQEHVWYYIAFTFILSLRCLINLVDFRIHFKDKYSRAAMFPSIVCQLYLCTSHGLKICDWSISLLCTDNIKRLREGLRVYSWKLKQLVVTAAQEVPAQTNGGKRMWPELCSQLLQKQS